MYSYLRKKISEFQISSWYMTLNTFSLPTMVSFPLTHQGLTLKHRETHGCLVSTVATDALVLKHQTISIHNAD